MVEKLISKRLEFQKGGQKEFINKAQAKLELTLKELSDLLKISTRTLSDWKREKFLISLKTAKLLSRKSKIKIPKSAKIKSQFWYVTKGARIGGINMYKKYGRVGGNPEIRKRRWREWWEQKGKFKKHPIINVSIPVKKPVKSSQLAEFTGIILGDGGISKYQITITLNFKADKKYIQFVVKLIKKLFNVKPRIYREEKDSVDNIVVSRIKLVKFCVEKLGLKIGNKVKHQIDIPKWIKANKKFQIACVRGLVDTDGSVFTHSYKVNGKWYSYKKLDFSSQSKPLRESVYEIMENIGLNPRFSQNKSVRLDSIQNMKKYFSIVGTHNPKHLRRYLN